MKIKAIAMCSLWALTACGAARIDGTSDDGADPDDPDNLGEAVQPLSGTQGDVVATGSGQFTLTWTNLDTAAIRAAVDDANARGALLGGRTMTQVLAGANRTLAYKTAAACATAKGSIAKLDDAAHRVGAWCFDSGDEDAGRSLDTSDWVPQAVASSNEGTVGGYTGPSAVAVTWYQPRPDHTAGAMDDPQNDRISFINTPASGESATYRHVLMVEPVVENGKLNLRRVKLHAGGIAWFGNILYVASTGGGMRAFDVRRMFAVHTDKDTVGLDTATPSDPNLYGESFAYVILQVASYKKTDAACTRSPTTLDAGLCFSGVTVNRSASPVSLISYEYRTQAEMVAAKVGSRIVHWPLDAATGLLTRAADGAVHSGKLYVTPTYQVQGVSIDHAAFFLSTSQSGGTFYSETDGDGVAPLKSAWVQGAETVSFTTTSFGNRLWSVTEVPGKRMLFWVYTSEMQ
jgi:hypothetical protein